MKNNFLLLIFISSLQIYAQSNIQYIETVPESFLKKYFEIKHEYNPMHVGDLWQFTSQNSIEEIVIKKDTLANGRRYFFKKYSNIYFSIWERNDNTKNSSYRLDVDDLNEDGNTNDELLLDSLEVPNNTEYYSYRYLSKNISNMIYSTQVVRSL